MVRLPASPARLDQGRIQLFLPAARLQRPCQRFANREPVKIRTYNGCVAFAVPVAECFAVCAKLGDQILSRAEDQRTDQSEQEWLLDRTRLSLRSVSASTLRLPGSVAHSLAPIIPDQRIPLPDAWFA